MWRMLFSSTNAPNYIPTSPDYFPVTPGNIYPDSSDDLTKDLLSSLSISPFHDDPYMKVIQAYDAIPPPQVIIALPTIMPPKRTSTSVAPTMTQDAIRQLVADSVATALEAQAANMANINKNIGTSGTPQNRRQEHNQNFAAIPNWKQKVSHRTKNCRSKGPATGSNLQSVFVTCHACGEKWHYKSQCSKTDNSTFHVSKKSLCDESLIIPMKEIWLDDKLNYVEEPVEIMDREFNQLRQRCIPIIKVKWNSEFTWEREDQIHAKYPHLFSNNTLSLN
ncbi:hypothetical protein Tco_0533702 [Tanacetum coccineum]